MKAIKLTVIMGDRRAVRERYAGEVQTYAVQIVLAGRVYY